MCCMNIGPNPNLMRPIGAWGTEAGAPQTWCAAARRRGGKSYFTSTLMELYQAARSSISPLVRGFAMMLMISFWRLPLR